MTRQRHLGIEAMILMQERRLARIEAEIGLIPDSGDVITKRYVREAQEEVKKRDEVKK